MLEEEGRANDLEGGRDGFVVRSSLPLSPLPPRPMEEDALQIMRGCYVEKGKEEEEK